MMEQSILNGDLVETVIVEQRTVVFTLFLHKCFSCSYLVLQAGCRKTIAGILCNGGI